MEAVRGVGGGAGARDFGMSALIGRRRLSEILRGTGGRKPERSAAGEEGDAGAQGGGGSGEGVQRRRLEPGFWRFEGAAGIAAGAHIEESAEPLQGGKRSSLCDSSRLPVPVAARVDRGAAQVRAADDGISARARWRWGSISARCGRWGRSMRTMDGRVDGAAAGALRPAGGRRRRSCAFTRWRIRRRSRGGLTSLLYPNVLRSVALTRLMVRKWVEPFDSRQLHLSTMIQQLMSCLKQTGGMHGGGAV